MEEKKIGQVIRIISDKAILIDAGKGIVKKGDNVNIYSLADEIFDLNNSSLGVFKNTKDTLVVTQVEDLYALCQKLETDAGYLPTVISPLLVGSVKVAKVLPVYKEDINPLEEYTDIISVGDFVEIV